jgi:hypothetical protein
MLANRISENPLPLPIKEIDVLWITAPLDCDGGPRPAQVHSIVAQQRVELEAAWTEVEKRFE